MKRTIITLLALLSLSLMVPAAYAQEYIPEVSTLSELQQAIAEAEPGDTIRLLQTIDVDTPVTIGIDGKPLTLCAAAGVQTYLRFVGDWGTASYCELYDLSIDGDNYFPYDSLVTIDTPNAVYMTRLDFANGISDNVGGAVRIDRGQVYAASCTFKNCSATRGGAVYAPAGTSFCPSECGFIGNSASFDGGAIYCEGGGEPAHHAPYLRADEPGLHPRPERGAVLRRSGAVRPGRKAPAPGGSENRLLRGHT